MATAIVGNNISIYGDIYSPVPLNVSIIPNTNHSQRSWLASHGFVPVDRDMEVWYQDPCCATEIICNVEYGCDNTTSLIKITAMIDGVEHCQITNIIGTPVVPSDMAVWGEMCTVPEVCPKPICEVGLLGCNCTGEPQQNQTPCKC